MERPGDESLDRWRGTISQAVDNLEKSASSLKKDVASLDERISIKLDSIRLWQASLMGGLAVLIFVAIYGFAILNNLSKILVKP